MPNRILVVPDVHAPFQRKSFISDLRKLVKKFKPTTIVFMGDIIDSHAVSRHQPEADAPSATEEFTAAKKIISKIAKITKRIPVKICLGNHDSRLLKLAGTVKIPSMCLKSLKEIFEMPKKWSIKHEHIVSGILFVHGRSAIPGKTARSYGMSTVEGHFHSKLELTYHVSPRRTLWSAYAGSAADDNAIAMTYAKNSLNRSVYGYIVIVRGVPQIVKM